MSTTNGTSDLARIVGRNIRRARLALDLTQLELGRRIGGKVSGQHISDWERGANKPSDPNLIAVAEQLGHNIAWFYTDHDEEPVAA